MPKHLVGTESRDGVVPSRLVPVFRDREELPTSSSLGDMIGQALADSRYLVVICSPRSAKSQWVSAERLTRYLTLMSIIAVRMFMITLIARTSPELSCENYLTTQQWSVLYLKIKRKSKLPKRVPTIGEVVVWIARLGGFLARKNDKMPGTIPLWRGWKRLNDLESGWCLALRHNTYG